MKLAYIAMDRTAHKAHGMLERHYSTVDFYLADADSKTLNIDVAELPIMASNVCIPADRTLRTVQHNLVMQELKYEHNVFLNSIYTRKNLQNEHLEGVPLTSGNIKKLSDIHYMQFNKEINKYSIETIGQDITEYDFVIIQDNQFVMSLMLDKQRDLFVRFTEQNKVILNLDFEIKHSHGKLSEAADFLFVDNIFLKSTEDNWYISQLREDRFSVSVYIPLEMQNSAAYIDFMAKRISHVVNSTFDVFKIGSLINRNTLACDGHYTHRAKLRYAKCASLVPTFTFWSQPKINNYLSLLIRNKKNRTGNSSVEKEKL